MNDSASELLKVLALLETERQEEFAEYQARVKGTPLSERKKQGITWYPVVITETELGLGQKLILEIEKTSQLNEPHSFQEGSVAVLFSNTEKPAEEITEIKGIISGVRNNNKLKFI